MLLIMTSSEKVIPGNIIVRQKGTKYHAGRMCGSGFECR